MPQSIVCFRVAVQMWLIDSALSISGDQTFRWGRTYEHTYCYQGKHYGRIEGIHCHQYRDAGQDQPFFNTEFPFRSQIRRGIVAQMLCAGNLDQVLRTSTIAKLRLQAILRMAEFNILNSHKEWYRRSLAGTLDSFHDTWRDTLVK